MADSNRKRTTDHEEIRTWAIAKGGYPVLVPMGDESEADDEVLSIAFDGDQQGMKCIDWSEFFTRFDAEELELDYEHIDDDGSAAARYELRRRER